MTRILPTLAFVAAGLPAWAMAECPPVPDRSAEMEQLFERARAATSEVTGKIVAGQLWEIYLDPPDEAAGALLQRGGLAQRAGDTAGSLDALGRLVDYCPHWAEGWNQRAFTYFLAGQFDRAEPDLREAIRLNPDHVGALSGLALTLMALGRDDEAQEWLREAVARNPWISERHMLTEPLPTEL